MITITNAMNAKTIETNLYLRSLITQVSRVYLERRRKIPRYLMLG